MEVIFMINKSFYLGFILATIIFSPYIFSSNNLYENVRSILTYNGHLKGNDKYHYLYYS